jgi:hypothetical protein
MGKESFLKSTLLLRLNNPHTKTHPKQSQKSVVGLFLFVPMNAKHTEKPYLLQNHFVAVVVKSTK